MKIQLCKCGAKLFFRNGIPVNKYCPNCRKAQAVKLREKKEKLKLDKLEKQKLKIEKHKTTKKYQASVIKKLMRENDRLYQEIGRAKHKSCYFGHTYSCLHHFIRKSQSLFTRYSFDNGIPICIYCHCSIHQAQDSTLEAQIVLDKGKEWLDRMVKGKHTIVDNKLVFLKEKNEYLKACLKEVDNFLI